MTKVNLEESYSYWQEKLSGEFSVTEISGEKARPPIFTFNTNICEKVFSKNSTSILKNLSESLKLSLFEIILTVFNILIMRYTNQEDVMIGTLSVDSVDKTGNRFINPLVLRTLVNRDSSFINIAQSMEKTVSEAAQHKNVRFENLIQDFSEQSQLNRVTFFQILFVLLEQSTKISDEPITRMHLEETRELTQQCDMSFFAFCENNVLKISCEYNADLYSAVFITRMLENLEALIGGLVTMLTISVDQIPIVSEAEKNQILEWRQTESAPLDNRTIHKIFESMVEQYPNNIAIQDSDKSLTYQALNERANQLALYLKSQKIDSEAVIGLCIGRSVDMIVGMLAILKAGAAYLPLDPEYPIERLKYMIKNSETKFVITNHKFFDLVSSINSEDSISIIDLQNDLSTTLEKFEDTSAPNNLAYVMYTSGSTGRPKGVMIEHRSVIRLAKNTNYIQIQPSDNVAQVSNAAFDAATFEIWGALLNGARLVIATTEILLDSKKFAYFLLRYSITILLLITGIFIQQIFQNSNMFKQLRYLLVGGDVLNFASIKPILMDDFKKPTHFFNCYGPTENTTVTTAFEIIRIPTNGENISIGKPITHTQVYILNDTYQFLPIGVFGEIYVGGIGLSRGYINVSQLTAERFIEASLDDQEKIRLYKTGDIGRWLPDGNIEFLKRNDNQLKLRGYRIELSEVESVLQSHPAIEQAIVVICDLSKDDKRLVAFISLKKTSQADEMQLKRFLEQTLPNYMVPSFFYFLDKIPINPNGKIDRKVLIKLSADNFKIKKSIDPTSLIEIEVTKIWKEILKISSLTRDDNFFDLGGYSLLMSKLQVRLSQLFHTTLSLVDIYQRPTIREQSEFILRILRDNTLDANFLPKQNETENVMVIPIRLQSTVTYLFFLPPRDGTVFSYLKLAKHLNSDFSIYGLQDVNSENNQLAYRTLEEMASHYLKAMRQVQPEGPYLLSGFSLGATLMVEVARQLREQGEEVLPLIMIDGWAKFSMQEREAASIVDEENFDEKLKRDRVRLLLNYKMPQIDNTIILFKAMELLPGYEAIKHPYNHWDQYATEKVAVCKVPGNHYTLLDNPHVAVLAQCFNRVLAHMFECELA